MDYLIDVYNLVTGDNHELAGLYCLGVLLFLCACFASFLMGSSGDKNG